MVGGRVGLEQHLLLGSGCHQTRLQERLQLLQRSAEGGLGLLDLRLLEAEAADLNFSVQQLEAALSAARPS